MPPLSPHDHSIAMDSIVSPWLVGCRSLGRSRFRVRLAVPVVFRTLLDRLSFDDFGLLDPSDGSVNAVC